MQFTQTFVLLAVAAFAAAQTPLEIPAGTPECITTCVTQTCTSGVTRECVCTTDFIGAVLPCATEACPAEVLVSASDMLDTVCGAAPSGESSAVPSASDSAAEPSASASAPTPSGSASAPASSASSPASVSRSVGGSSSVRPTGSQSGSTPEASDDGAASALKVAFPAVAAAALAVLAL
ncbi:hypothetical protein BKA70DRAFT_1315011 [Coprinopsis sp. MPI-PUGE-AT-0042]|nr:hypothetical protein BKA70DRAFT_1315011 [Coprinopsis sp. MPI-PUGE-AT-0042]